MSAEDAGESLGFAVRAANMAQLARLAEGKGAPVADLLVIDTPPGDAATVQASIDAAALWSSPLLLHRWISSACGPRFRRHITATGRC